MAGIRFGSLTLSGSKLYGMANDGGASSNGVIFSIGTDGTGFGLLHSFRDPAGPAHDGANPYGSLTQVGSMLYGMTANGGSAGLSDIGAIFRIATDGTGYTLLHSFTGTATDGARPFGSLTFSGSKLYGMTSQGGASDAGTLFSIGLDGTGYSVIESFAGAPADGAFPYGDLTFSDDGSTYYGMTSDGGTADLGVIFSHAVVPEPGACALLGLGALLLSPRRRDARGGCRGV